MRPGERRKGGRVVRTIIFHEYIQRADGVESTGAAASAKLYKREIKEGSQMQLILTGVWARCLAGNALSVSRGAARAESSRSGDGRGGARTPTRTSSCYAVPGENGGNDQPRDSLCTICVYIGR